MTWLSTVVACRIFVQIGRHRHETFYVSRLNKPLTERNDDGERQANAQLSEPSVRFDPRFHYRQGLLSA